MSPVTWDIAGRDIAYEAQSEASKHMARAWPDHNSPVALHCVIGITNLDGGTKGGRCPGIRGWSWRVWLDLHTYVLCSLPPFLRKYRTQKTACRIPRAGFFKQGQVICQTERRSAPLFFFLSPAQAFPTLVAIGSRL